MIGTSLVTNEGEPTEPTRKVALSQCVGLEIRLDTPKGAWCVGTVAHLSLHAVLLRSIGNEADVCTT